MVTSKIQRFEKPDIEEKIIPAEVNNLKSLISDNGWKICMERIDKTIKETQELCMKPVP